MVRRRVDADVQDAVLRELGHRSLSGTAAHLLPLIFIEATMPAAHGFSGVLVIGVVLMLLGVRLVAHRRTTRSLGTLRGRWTLIAIGGIAINLVWGVLNAAIQLRAGSGMDSMVIGILISGLAVGGVTAFAPNRAMQTLALSALVAPTIACGVAGNLTPGVTLLFCLFFGYMTALGVRASREYWQGVETAKLLVAHAIAQQKAAVAAIAMTEKLREEIEHGARMEIELRAAQKLEAVGRLAAGIAHEINTPLQFVTDNCNFLRDGMADLDAATAEYAQLVSELVEGTTTSEVAELRAAQIREERDLAYLHEQVSVATERTLEGLDRIAKIVGATKDFAASNTVGKSRTDINRMIESTLVMCRAETTAVADVSTELAELPLADCHRGELSQAFLNVIVNAAYAVKGTGQKGQIKIKTSMPGTDKIRVEITDTGGGIPAEIMDKIFEPFFTTKPVGDGTGQGLAVARAIVVGKHGGTLDVSTVPRVGSTFAITIPV
jgi:signal transduction histidine kinase